MSKRERSLTISVSVSLTALAALAALSVLVSERRGRLECHVEKMPTFVTLHYKTPYDAPIVVHNCALAQRAGARMIVYTEDMEARYCRTCTCIRFRPTHCTPPNPRANSVNHCEKLAFMARMIPAMGALAYLDADLVVLRQSFFRMLSSRARTHDFLATYGEGAFWEKHKYRNYFNSGLIFVRNVQSANYTDLIPWMYRIRTGYDQSVLSLFVHRYYNNWDTLSWKWHCRGMLRNKWDIPAEDCYTIHDRGELKRLLPRLNFTLIKS